MPTTTFAAHKDAYTKKADPDANFGTETRIWVQRGSLLGDNPRYSFVAIDYDLSDRARFVRIVEAVLEFSDAGMSSGFPLEAYTLDDAWTETGITWNNQPVLDVLLDEVETDATVFKTWFEVTGAIPDLLATVGGVEVGLRHAQEPQGTGIQNSAWWSREGNTAPVLLVTWEAQAEGDLACSLTVQRAAGSDLASAVQPTQTDVPASGQVQGRVSRTFFTALEEFRSISEEIGSSLTVDGAELRRVFQLVDSVKGVSTPQARTSVQEGNSPQDRIRRGDAVLFAFEEDAVGPGAVVVVQGVTFEVVSVTSFEVVEDHVLFEEASLRRAPTSTSGRVTGVVGQQNGVGGLESSVVAWRITELEATVEVVP